MLPQGTHSELRTVQARVGAGSMFPSSWYAWSSAEPISQGRTCQHHLQLQSPSWRSTALLCHPVSTSQAGSTTAWTARPGKGRGWEWNHTVLQGWFLCGADDGAGAQLWSTLVAVLSLFAWPGVPWDSPAQPAWTDRDAGAVELREAAAGEMVLTACSSLVTHHWSPRCSREFGELQFKQLIRSS